jgi:hypothetical protein
MAAFAGVRALQRIVCPALRQSPAVFRQSVVAFPVALLQSPKSIGAQFSTASFSTAAETVAAVPDAETLAALAVLEEEVPEWMSMYNLGHVDEDDENARGGGPDGGAVKRVRKVDEKGRAYGTGRRKTASARVWIKQGTGKVTINKRDGAEYMQNQGPYMDHMKEPFEVTDTDGEFDVWCTTQGGGLTGAIVALNTM